MAHFIVSVCRVYFEPLASLLVKFKKTTPVAMHRFNNVAGDLGLVLAQRGGLVALPVTGNELSEALVPRMSVRSLVTTAVHVHIRDSLDGFSLVLGHGLLDLIGR